MSPSFPKKNFLVLLSMPKILNFFFEKNKDDSDPTKPQDPVIKAIFIKNNPLSFFLFSTKYKYRSKFHQ